MDTELSNSLEAIANLLYLIRESLNNPAAISAYVGLAKDRIRIIAIQSGAASTAGGEAGLPFPGPPVVQLMEWTSRFSQDSEGSRTV
jgi:hypothetical protein